MKAHILLFCVLPLCTTLALPPQETGTAVLLRNPGFEAEGTTSLPAEWSPATGIYTASRRTAMAHDGTASLEIRHQFASSTTVESSPVVLKVGRPYRLSVWIKTEGVGSDPVARYPTALPATATMASFPFTSHTTTVGSSRDWTRVEATFFATQKEDRVRLHLGRNGSATGTVWFDDVQLEEIKDVTQMIPMETVRWSGPAFRYTDRGWTFVHIEGDPYARGVQ